MKPTLLSIYAALTSGEINVEQAAAAYGMTPKVLKMSMTKHGDRFALVMDTLDKIIAGQATRTEAVKTLGITPRSVNALMNTWGAQRPLSVSAVERSAPKVKFAVHKKFAIDFIAGKMSVEQAAEAAGISERQMRRDVAALLKKHFAMMYRDLAKLSLYQLRRLSAEIEDKERMDEATRILADDVSRGKTTPTQVAVERLAAQRVAKFPTKRSRKPRVAHK
jgi:hypothetical protein